MADAQVMVRGKKAVGGKKSAAMEAASTESADGEDCDDIRSREIVDWEIVQKTCKESVSKGQKIFSVPTVDVFRDEKI